MPTDLTPRQKQVYTFITAYLERNGYPPTLSEISEKLKIRISAVRNHLLLMEKKKALRYVPNISRGIELLLEKPSGIPIYGSAPAGHPFLSQENILESFEVKRYVAASDDIFGVYVRGDSMKDANLYTGDLLFVDPNKHPRNGEIVVALVEGEPTIKRFYQERETIELRPENKKYKPIVVRKSGDAFKLVGVVVGMIRALDKKKIDNIISDYRGFARAS